MYVAGLCRRNVVTIAPRQDIAAAAALMRERHIGYLIVVEPAPVQGGERPIGVLTDRDIVVSVVAPQVNARAICVEDVMTRNTITVSENELLGNAVAAMRRSGVRRLPVVDGLGLLAGILSMDDVLEALSDELSNVAGSVRNGQRIEGSMRP